MTKILSKHPALECAVRNDLTIQKVRKPLQCFQGLHRSLSSKFHESAKFVQTLIV